MAESLAEKLKRLAKQKREAAAASAVTEVKVTADVQPLDPEVFVENSEANLELRHKLSVEKLSDVSSEHVSGTEEEASVSDTATGDKGSASVTEGSDGCGQGFGDKSLAETKQSPSESDIESAGKGVKLTPTPSDHPLAMQFAEMESALLTADPKFKTILRDVHRHLGTDPDLVTLMTEAEVALVVKGLVVFANAEIVEPAKAKAIKAASKKAISADDL